MSRKRTFIKGTFILATTGVVSRIIGFLYRIFLSQTFGAEQMGLYQLIFPVYALCFSFSTAGIETAISRCVSAKIALHRDAEARSFLVTSMLLSLALSILCMITLQKFALPISTYFLQDSRTYDLVYLLAYAFPFASIHSCIVGYYLGLKQTTIPAASQLLEQGSRVLSIFLIYYLCLQNNVSCNISLAVIGLIIGEMISSIFVVYYISRRNHSIFPLSISSQTVRKNMRELLPLSTPLTANRVTLNTLHSIEAISIPLTLQAYGFTSTEALSTYGVLTGMALPCLLFPTAFTSAFSSMLLPTVAEIQAKDNKKEIKLVVSKTIQYCTFLGITCFISFFLFSDIIGNLLFNNAEAGNFLKALSWLCPFLYLNTTLLAIINGLGKPLITFFLNATSLLIRIGFIFFLIPEVGIYGYLCGLLISQIFLTLGSMITFRKLCII